MDLAQEERLDDFFDSGDWVVVPGMNPDDETSCWRWEDFAAVEEMLHENPELFYFTLTEDEDYMYIQQGHRFVNRVAYFLSRNPTDIKPNELIRYL
jgi:hypothetical protein